MASVAYKERLWMSIWASTPLGLSIAVISVVSFMQAIGGIKLGNGLAPITLLLGLDLVLIILLANFLVLRIEVTSRELKVSYGIVGKAVQGGDIVSATPVRAGFWLYGGIGIRIGADSSLAFTTSMGGAVRIVSRNGRSFMFSSKRPEYLSSVLRTLAENRPMPQESHDGS